MKPDDFPDHARQYQARIRASIERILSSAESMNPRTSKLDISKDAIDSSSIRWIDAWKNISLNGRALLRSADHIASSDPWQAHKIIISLSGLLAGFDEALQISSDLHQTREISAMINAHHIRDAKNNTEAEMALRLTLADIIEGKSREEIGARGYAGAILAKVNKGLKASGFEEVSVDVVRRRLNDLRS